MRESYVCGLKTSILVADPGEGPEEPALLPPYFWTKLRPEGPKNIFLKNAPRLIRYWISRIKDNFVRLTHKSGQIVLNT